MTVTVIIPTIPGRTEMLARAVASVKTQILPPDDLIVVYDELAEGAAATRNRGLGTATTDYVAFLDDDDELHPTHLAALAATAAATGGDLVYPWYDGINQGLFNPDPYGRVFDSAAEQRLREVGNFIPITCLIRTEMLRSVGGFTPHPGSNEANPCEDWFCWLKLLDAGATFVHHPAVTWTWHGHEGHTSGRPWTMTGHPSSTATVAALDAHHLEGATP